jgi:hypothetical protein
MAAMGANDSPIPEAVYGLFESFMTIVALLTG